MLHVVKSLQWLQFDIHCWHVLFIYSMKYPILHFTQEPEIQLKQFPKLHNNSDTKSD